MELGKYPQKPLYGLTEDGIRYIAGYGMYCDVCGWPADDSPAFLHRGVCTEHSSLDITPCELIEQQAFIAMSELQQMAAKRNLIGTSR